LYNKQKRRQPVFSDQEAAAMMLGDDSDIDWNDCNDSLLQMQESMVDPLQVAQEIYQLQDDDTDPNPNVQAETTASTSQPSSMNTSNSASSITVPPVPSSSVSQQPSTTSSLPSATPTSNSYRVPIPFTQHIGPTQLLDSDSTPLNFFLQIFGKTTFQHIADQSNLYAAQNPPPFRYKWVDTNKDEIMLLIGIILATRIHRLPSWEDYWSQNPILGAPGIIMGMPITRFKALMKCLHLNDMQFHHYSTWTTWL
jgi:hypothetical protein